jgi:hypothetical protein
MILHRRSFHSGSQLPMNHTKRRLIKVKNLRFLTLYCRFEMTVGLNKEYNNRKIDMANIDHCGTCHYHYEKVNTIIDNKKESASFPIKVC